MLRGRKILLGVCGSIAAYKAATLVRLLVKGGAEVKVIMTDSATQFITPLTLSTLSQNAVLSTFVSRHDEGVWNNHVALGLWADAMLIAPASANTLAKMAQGICDNVLLATYFSARCPVFLAPAMDVDMYAHPAIQNNITTLRSAGNTMLTPGYGELASGLVGEGRMQEPEELVSRLEEHFSEGILAGKTVLITAGPTHEAIDPVRFIGNRSTGKMGFAIAEAAALQKAKVIIISGPVREKVRRSGIEVVPVVSAEEMFKACKKYYEAADICVFSAAVADYKPKTTASQKIKKADNHVRLELVPTYDIAAEMGKRKQPNQLNIGFALETENGIVHAREKLSAKNLDLIVLNSLEDPGAGFGYETNKITIITKNNNSRSYPLKGKREVAADIIKEIIDVSKG